MLDPVIQWFARVFAAIGRGVGTLIAAILWPFAAGARWYRRRGSIVRIAVAATVAAFLLLNAYFMWQTQVWADFDPDYADKYDAMPTTVSAGEAVAPEGDAQTARTCAPSQIVQAASDLTRFNVDENSWIPSMLFYKLGFFGIDWANTPFFDNKASFQLGVHSAVQRTTVELTDTLGRVRGTSEIDPDLRNARGALQFDEATWYFGLDPFGPKTPTPSFYRTGAENLDRFNVRLTQCDATFDPRADNLINLVDRIASDIGSTSEAIRNRAELRNSGWFDFRADNEFWRSVGQLYGYYGVLKASQTDFADVIQTRGLTALWDRMEEQLRTALELSPLVVSNGDEDGIVMPTHLTTMGFYVLRVRANLTEIRDVLRR